MASYVPGCMGNYNFENIARAAQKRFIEGQNTIDLMTQVSTYQEREEIALVSLLSLDDDQIADLELECKFADKCKVINCRNLLKKIISENLKVDIIPAT